MEVNVLGTKYKVYVSTPEHDEKLKTCDGYIMPEVKEIMLDRNSKSLHQQKVLTHELTHAFLYESGLDVESWGNNEEIVDWIAIQLSKMAKVQKDSLNKLKPYYTKPKEDVENGQEGNEDIPNENQ